MRKLLTAGIFGTILSLTGANYAGASIISRGFFDEAMENYATNTALDLKANQSDLTALSNKIGDAWPYGSDISGGLYNLSWQLYPQETTLENASDLVRFLFGGKIESGINQGGVLNILGQSVVDTGAYDINTGQIDNGFRSLTQLTNGWTSTDGTPYLGVKSLNDELLWPIKSFTFESTPEAELFGLRTLDTYPDGTTVKDVLLNMFQSQGSVYYNGNYPKFGVVGERIFNGGKVMIPAQAFYSSFNATNPALYDLDTYDGLFGLNAKTGSYYWGPENEEYKFSNIPYFEELFPSTSPEKSIAMTDMATTILSNYTDPGFPGLAGVTNRLLNGWTDANGVVANPGLKGMYEGWTDKGGIYFPGLYDLSKGETLLLNAYNSESVFLLIQGAKATTIDGVDYTGPVYPLWKLSEGIDKIGDLPSGSLLGLSPDSDQIYKIADGTDTPVYPANVAEMIQQLYGAPQAGHHGIIPVIGRIISDLSQSITTRIGTLPDGKTVTDMISETDAKIGTVPDGKNLAGMISETDAKIGDLPTEIPNTSPIWVQYGFAEMGTPIDLPDTIGGMFAMLFNDDGPYNEPSLTSIMTRILMGFSTSSNARIQGLSSLTSVYKLTGDSPIVTAVNANTAKIGTLPTEYATVGAALTAMKSDIDAKNLPSTSDDGQYVLTAKKVGDTITYTWVKMDLTNEEQAQ